MVQEHRNSLQPGYRLHWYVIKRILGQGGFGITYLAEDTNLNQEVAIKEYLPVELAVREGDHSIHPVSGEHGEQFSWGLDRFMSEAQTLAQFKHPNIVRVLAVFPENNTAYMVMEYEKGQAMNELLRQRKTLDEDEVGSIIFPILDGLEQIHNAGFIHRDIKPPNIFIREDGTPVLLDFGSARQSLGERTRTLTSMVSPGFAPFEQYVSKSDKQGPWTDIYGLGATLYRSVIGRAPSEAMDRSESLLHTERDSYVRATEIAPEGYSPSLLNAIDHALVFKAEQRPQSIGQWRAELTQAHDPLPESEAETVRVDPSDIQPAKEVDDPAAAKITIMADEPGAADTGEVANAKALPWYRKPLKIIAVLFGIFLLLAVLDDDKKPVNGGPSGQENGNGLSVRIPPVDIDIPVVNPGSENTGTFIPDIDTATPGPAPEEDPPVTDTPDTPAAHLIDNSDRRKLARIRRQLERNPDNDRAREELRKLAEKYESKVKKAFQENKYDLAEAYIEAMLAVSPENSRLGEMLKTIRAKRDSE